MLRPLRVEYPGAIYHLMCRGGHREAIFRDDADRRAGKETNEQRAERLVREWLEAEGRSQAELHTRPKGDPKKTQWALRLRAETPMTRQWIATRLAMGSASYLSHLTAKGMDCRL